MKKLTGRVVAVSGALVIAAGLMFGLAAPSGAVTVQAVAAATTSAPYVSSSATDTSGGVDATSDTQSTDPAGAIDATSDTNGGSSGLAFTGVAVLGLGVLAFALLASGLVLLVLGRRTRVWRSH